MKYLIGINVLKKSFFPLVVFGYVFIFGVFMNQKIVASSPDFFLKAWMKRAELEPLEVIRRGISLVKYEVIKSQNNLNKVFGPYGFCSYKFIFSDAEKSTQDIVTKLVSGMKQAFSLGDEEIQKAIKVYNGALKMFEKQLQLCTTNLDIHLKSQATYAVLQEEELLLNFAKCPC